MSNELEVTLIASTAFSDFAAKRAAGYIPQEEFMGVTALFAEEDQLLWKVGNDERLEEIQAELNDLFTQLPHSSDELAEFAGRNCYESFDRPNPKTATNEGYLANIINQGHLSVLEHASATFYVKGISRNLLLELERHRHLSLSVVSQRYVDQSEYPFVVPPAITRSSMAPELMGKISEATEWSQILYAEIVEQLMSEGLPRKKAREAARSVLPGGLETRIVVTGNLRTWRYVIAMRNTEHADAEIQQFAKVLLTKLKKIAPNSFQDMEI